MRRRKRRPMSIRLIAQELYRLQKKVDALEEELQRASWDCKEALKERLRRARAERDRMKRVLDGQKDSRR